MAPDWSLAQEPVEGTFLLALKGGGHANPRQGAKSDALAHGSGPGLAKLDRRVQVRTQLNAARTPLKRARVPAL